MNEPTQRKLADLITHSPRKQSHNGELPKRQGYLMPLPNQDEIRSVGNHSRQTSDSLSESFQQCRVTDLDIGIPIDEIDERRIQEERDAVSDEHY